MNRVSTRHTRTADITSYFQMQGFADAMFFVLAKIDTDPEDGSTGDSADSSNVHRLPTVADATYLLVDSTAHDLRAGSSL